MREVVVKAGETINFPSGSIVSVKLIAVKGGLARVSITAQDSAEIRQAESEGMFRERRVAASLGERT